MFSSLLLASVSQSLCSLFPEQKRPFPPPPPPPCLSPPPAPSSPAFHLKLILAVKLVGFSALGHCPYVCALPCLLSCDCKLLEGRAGSNSYSGLLLRVHYSRSKVLGIITGHAKQKTSVLAMEGFLTMSPEPFQNPTRCTDVVTPYSSVSSDSWTHAPLYITTNSPPPPPPLPPPFLLCCHLLLHHHRHHRHHHRHHHRLTLSIYSVPGLF